MAKLDYGHGTNILSNYYTLLALSRAQVRLFLSTRKQHYYGYKTKALVKDIEGGNKAKSHPKCRMGLGILIICMVTVFSCLREWEHRPALISYYFEYNIRNLNIS